MPESPRVLFYGSPEFAVPSLQALIDSRYRPVAVVTQPDARAGRGQTLRPPPIKELAASRGIAVLQPASLKERAAIAQISSLRPTLQIVAAYGQLIPGAILNLPEHGTLNVHASLLPRWRGASPISAAILHGDHETGVTIMLVDETEDTGDVLRRLATRIDPGEHAGQLSDRLARLGAELLLETIPDWLDDRITPQPQDHARATRARRVRKRQGLIDWTASADEVSRRVRAYTPWPGATTNLGRSSIRITQASSVAEQALGEPGQVVHADETIVVATGDGMLAIERLQRAGKRELSAEEFARGTRDLVGQRFGHSND